MKVLNPLLWILQVVLAILFIYSGYLKLFTPIARQAAMYPWTGQVAPVFLRFMGVIDLLGGIGILIPFTRIYAASGIVLLMISAAVFHITRGEASVIGFNIAVAIVAGFIAWGRKRLA
ncbi:DoxX family protein [Chitinophaga sancti]|uniref:DoxX family protein n=1 Tax=Chitinophaga sancti TaxID=1004 RepID=A0A1K1PYZ5_9BACT|nr:DoxX family protein [Chitinophaga sancti]WQD61495.1 DoxX family protein [Chitinophaga sancti]WQG92948.1 DoxX family protein [Chitinophaga sancti]SFW52693.1 DoxX-like family protein [Chitinophaga sancti]